MRLRTEIVDFASVRRRSQAERIALAKRIFALWQPIFSHLDDLDYTFHLKKHVEDESAVQIRGLFGIDEAGRDRALVIVRVHEHQIDGRTWARMSINAGVDPSLVQRHFGQRFIACEPWRYLLRHPQRPFFVVDCVVSAASYCIYEKMYAGFCPTRERPIPEPWWPLAEMGATALGGRAVEGAPREVRRFGIRVRDPRARQPSSERAKAAAQFFHELTGGDPELGVLVMAPMSIHAYSTTMLKFGWASLQRELPWRAR